MIDAEATQEAIDILYARLSEETKGRAIRIPRAVEYTIIANAIDYLRQSLREYLTRGR